MLETGSGLDQAGRKDLQAMKRRIDGALADARVREMVAVDFIDTFKRLGLEREAANRISAEVIAMLRAAVSIDMIEGEVLAKLKGTRVGGKDLVEILEEKLADRADLIFGQIEPHLLGWIERGVRSVIDYGCGDGQVSLRMRDRLGLGVAGCDVRDYRCAAAREHGMHFYPIEGNHVAVGDGSFEAAIMTNVAHHEADNDVLLAELSRLTTMCLVVIETVPFDAIGADGERQERERVFLNDYLYNRCFHNADIPVPGTYERIDQWPARFEKHGWRLLEMEDLGRDQPTIADRHVLYVFARGSGPVLASQQRTGAGV